MIELQVQGMTCGSCVRGVTRAVEAIDPQAQVHVDLATGRVRVEGGRSSAEALGKTIGEAGYAAAPADAAAPAAARKKSGCCCG